MLGAQGSRPAGDFPQASFQRAAAFLSRRERRRVGRPRMNWRRASFASGSRPKTKTPASVRSAGVWQSLMEYEPLSASMAGLWRSLPVSIGSLPQCRHSAPICLTRLRFGFNRKRERSRPRPVHTRRAILAPVWANIVRMRSARRALRRRQRWNLNRAGQAFDVDDHVTAALATGFDGSNANRAHVLKRHRRAGVAGGRRARLCLFRRRDQSTRAGRLSRRFRSSPQVRNLTERSGSVGATLAILGWCPSPAIRFR